MPIKDRNMKLDFNIVICIFNQEYYFFGFLVMMRNTEFATIIFFNKLLFKTLIDLKF